MCIRDRLSFHVYWGWLIKPHECLNPSVWVALVILLDGATRSAGRLNECLSFGASLRTVSTGWTVLEQV